MQVWIVNHFALTPDQPGGTRHIRLAQELKKRGIDVTIVGAGRQHISNRNRVPEGHVWHREVVEGIRFHWLCTPTASSNHISRVWNNFSFAISVIASRGLSDLPKPDLIMGTSPDLMSALSAYGVSRFLGIPFVLEIRDIWPLSAVEIGNVSRNHPYVLILSLIERFLYRKADWIVTLLPEAWRHIVPRGGCRNRITWIPNGVVLEDTPMERASAETDSTDFTLMYAGSHGNANNLDLLLDAANLLKSRGQHKNLKIRLVGDGPNKQALMERAAREGLDFISFEASVPKTDIELVLQEANAFLLLFHSREIYRYGISANKLFDYLAAARPIIIALEAEYNPVMMSGAGVCIPPQNPNALAEAITTLKKMSPEERHKFGLRARTYVTAKHDNKLLGAKLAGVIENLIGKS